MRGTLTFLATCFNYAAFIVIMALVMQVITLDDVLHALGEIAIEVGSYTEQGWQWLCSVYDKGEAVIAETNPVKLAFSLAVFGAALLLAFTPLFGTKRRRSHK